MTTAIIGVGNLGGTVARHLVAGDERVVLAAADEAHAKALADELGPNASAASVEDAIAGADVVVLATWLDQTREFLPADAGLLEDKIVVDPSNPIGFENGQMIRTLPEGRVVRLRGRGPAPRERALRQGVRVARRRRAARDEREPRPAGRALLRHRRREAEAVAQRLIRAAGFAPLKVGGASEAGRIEGPDGELQGRILDLDEARATIATEESKA